MSTRITIVWGKETFWPTRSNGFEVGPFTLELELQPHEELEDAFKQGHKLLADLAQKMFIAKRNQFVESVGVSKQ